MNILVFSWRDPKHPMAGGAEQVMHEHMKGWIKAGHKVTLFSSAFIDENGKWEREKETFDGVSIIRRGRQILGVQIMAFFWYLFEAHEKYDLIVDQFHGIPFFTVFYTRPPKLAVVQEVAREVWLKNHLPFPLNYIIGLVGYIFEPVVYFFYKNISFMTGSQSAKDDLISVGVNPKKITIVPHGVKLFLPKKPLKKEKNKTVVFLGAIARDKGIVDALRTFGLLNKRGEYVFWVIGKAGEAYMKEINEFVDTLNIGENIKFWGFVSNEKKFELLARAHLLVNPSIREGWGLVNIEANSVATPVVAYHSQGLIDSVKPGINGIIVKENTPLELANEIEKLLKNESKLSKLQKGAVSWSKEFTWSESSQKSLELVEKLCKK